MEYNSNHDFLLILLYKICSPTTSWKDSLKSDGQQLHQYQQNGNHLSPKDSLNSDGQQFHQYQQNEQSPLT